MGLALIVLLGIGILILFRWYFNTFPYVTGIDHIVSLRITDGDNTIVLAEEANPEHRELMDKLNRAVPRYQWGSGSATVGHHEKFTLRAALRGEEGDLVTLYLPDEGTRMKLPPGRLDLHPKGNEWDAPQFLAVVGEIGLEYMPEEVPPDYRMEIEKLLRKWYSAYGD
jgi:hypothetical protein